jgi:hypothetical protein
LPAPLEVLLVLGVLGAPPPHPAAIEADTRSASVGTNARRNMRERIGNPTS